MSWFESKSSKEKKSSVLSVLSVMLADGEISEEEKFLFIEICKKNGLSDSEFSQVLNSPEKVKFTPPQNTSDRINTMFDCILMMMVDGEIDKREFNLCTTIAVGLGFNPQIVPDMIDYIVNSIIKHETDEKIKSFIGDFLKQY